MKKISILGIIVLFFQNSLFASLSTNGGGEDTFFKTLIDNVISPFIAGATSSADFQIFLFVLLFSVLSFAVSKAALSRSSNQLLTGKLLNVVCISFSFISSIAILLAIYGSTGGKLDEVSKAIWGFVFLFVSPIILVGIYFIFDNILFSRIQNENVKRSFVYGGLTIILITLKALYDLIYPDVSFLKDPSMESFVALIYGIVLLVVIVLFIINLFITIARMFQREETEEDKKKREKNEKDEKEYREQEKENKERKKNLESALLEVKKLVKEINERFENTTNFLNKESQNINRRS